MFLVRQLENLQTIREKSFLIDVHARRINRFAVGDRSKQE
jgi:hypothetical protein